LYFKLIVIVNIFHKVLIKIFTFSVSNMMKFVYLQVFQYRKPIIKTTKGFEFTALRILVDVEPTIVYNFLEIVPNVHKMCRHTETQIKINEKERLFNGKKT